MPLVSDMKEKAQNSTPVTDVDWGDRIDLSHLNDKRLERRVRKREELGIFRRGMKRSSRESSVKLVPTSIVLS